MGHEVTYCDAIRPHDVVRDQSGAVYSIKASLFDLCRTPPVGPVDEAVGWKSLKMLAAADHANIKMRQKTPQRNALGMWVHHNGTGLR